MSDAFGTEMKDSRSVTTARLLYKNTHINVVVGRSSIICKPFNPDINVLSLELFGFCLTNMTCNRFPNTYIYNAFQSNCLVFAK